MKRLAVILLAFGFTMYGQVKKVEKLIDAEDGRFYYAKFSPNGKDILLTSENYKGLWLYETESKQLLNITDEEGAGYEPAFTEKGETVVYRTSYFKNMMRYSSLKMKKLKEAKTEVLEKEARDVLPPISLGDGAILYKKGNQFKLKESARRLNKGTKANDVAVYIEEQKIVLYNNGTEKILAPLGEGNYIWPSVSPDKEYILFTFPGKGTYICDLTGKIISSLGEANAPEWSNDGKWIVCMKDMDDGHVVTSSDIFVKSFDGKIEYKLTDTKDAHEMYPVWSPVEQRVIYNTTNGSIYQIELDIE